MKRHLLTVALLIVAVMFYALGSSPLAGSAAAVALLLGATFETAFWVRVVRRKRYRHEQGPASRYQDA